MSPVTSASIVSTRAPRYRHPIVKLFLTAIEERAPVSEDLRIRIYSAVQEALMNAVLHGNLQLDPKLRNSLEGLAAAEEQIDAKLRIARDRAEGRSVVDAAWNSTTSSSDGSRQRQSATRPRAPRRRHSRAFAGVAWRSCGHFVTAWRSSTVERLLSWSSRYERGRARISSIGNHLGYAKISDRGRRPAGAGVSLRGCCAGAISPSWNSRKAASRLWN